MVVMFLLIGPVALYIELPACTAEIVQIPAAFPVTLLPLIEQIDGVEDESITARPEEAEAETVPVAGRVIEAGTVRTRV